MYLMNVKPWESSKWVVPPLEQMSGKLRQNIEEANPEKAIERGLSGRGEGSVPRADEVGAERKEE